MTNPTKPREFWIKQGLRGKFSGTKYPDCVTDVYTEGFIHVVEFSDYQSALDEIERQERELRVLRSTISRMNTETIETLRQQHAEIDKLKRELWSLKEADGRPYEGGNVADK